MFGWRKDNSPETLSQKFYPIVSDERAFDAFAKAFNAQEQTLHRAFVSRFCFLEWAALAFATQKHPEPPTCAAFLCLATTFKYYDEIMSIEAFFGSGLELQLARATLALIDKPRASLLHYPFKTLLEVGLKMRNESYSRLVGHAAGKTKDLATVFMALAAEIQPQITGGLLPGPTLTKQTGDQITCLAQDFDGIREVIKRL